ncbi:hypothetical protein Hanom_Chr13g01222331 [Helianthus anomalus]
MPLPHIRCLSSLAVGFPRSKRPTECEPHEASPSGLALLGLISTYAEVWVSSPIATMGSCSSRITKEKFGTYMIQIKSFPSKISPTLLQVTSGMFLSRGSDFPNMYNLYNIMQETLQVSRNVYSLGQSTRTRVGGMERNIASVKSNISYIREHMVYQADEEDEDEGDNMDSDYAMTAKVAWLVK